MHWGNIPGTAGIPAGRRGPAGMPAVPGKSACARTLQRPHRSGYALTVAWPAKETVMTPPHMHMHWQVLVSAGAPSIITVGDPGAQGAVVAGMQGCGVSTPSAAAVAAATCGFDGLMHMPKPEILAIGMLALMVAAI